jgi:hypothetical protein
MSIVITVVTENVVVQVSDVRLTSIKYGTPLDKKQRKSILVVGTDAAFVIGWTGFAESINRRFNTGDWLFRTLNRIKAYEKPLVDILGDLTGEAEVAFRELPDAQDTKGCHFSLGGWHRENGAVKLFGAIIYNNLVYNPPVANDPRQAQEPLTESATVSPTFLYLPASFLPVEFPHLVRVDSPGMKPEWIKEQMRVLRIVMDNQGGEQAIVRACVDVARQAAGWTGTISKDLIVATLKKSGDFTVSYLPESDTEEYLFPDIITPRGATTQASVRAIVSGDEVSGTFKAQVLKRDGE